METIRLIHLGGSTKDVEVIRAHRELKLDVRWSISGIYVLDLKLNQLKDGRLKRGGQSVWRAQDIEAAKQLYWRLINPTEKVDASVALPPLVKAAEAHSLAYSKICNCTREYCPVCETVRKVQ